MPNYGHIFRNQGSAVSNSPRIRLNSLLREAELYCSTSTGSLLTQARKVGFVHLLFAK
jgi:hypothetical protein